MKSKTANLRRLDFLGNGDRPSDQEIFNAVLKRWRQKLGYFSIFAAVPAILASNLPVARSDETKNLEASVAGQGTKLLKRLNRNISNRALLKRQSKFRLPHQKDSFALLAPLAGNDDCPGRTIPGGNYTAAAPFIDSGDTTGANSTVSSLSSVYYYFYGYHYHAAGPDHVYSFTVTSVGPNPQIEVSTTSGSYKPLIYVLQGGTTGPCPAGTGNLAANWMRWVDGRQTRSSTVDLDLQRLPLNWPLHVFVDSALNDAQGAGPYTIRMWDVTIAPTPSPNQIDDTQFFVRQHYRDFLNREADAEGLAFWMNEITSCGGNQQCIEVKRINDSGSFFMSIEFQETGYLAYRMYKAAYGDLPNAPVPIKLDEFLPDTQRIGQGVIVKQAGWEQVLENNKRNFALEFVQRARFTSAFSPTTSATEFVDKLTQNAGTPLSQTERDQLVSELSSGAKSRADVLRAIAENPKLVQAEFNRAFVLMQYFGYLRRNPNEAPDGNFVGYNFWLNKMNQFNGNFVDAEMVKAFLSSIEYRQRFGP